ncbi:1507_t:CDS:10 [Funneliformis geosporum]|uniref:Vacuolar import and degradation protein 21 n=1 Tax=Funneliformis geosporum TaxID=1117311 RepID=A0A9W4X0K8_9GLOM|nr:7633_t:CDS:10 [Funneliformis geosporum]CAI2186328.1 1507_t:CDS:10 [Funneliformis geosporum]
MLSKSGDDYSNQLEDFLQSHKLGEKNLEVDKSSTKIASIDNATNQTSNTAENIQQSQQINIQSQTQGDQTIQTKKKRASIPTTERMITRAASGAINPKTVDEILKEAERGSSLSSSTSPTSTTTPRIPIRLNIPQRKQSFQRTNNNILLSEGRLSSTSTGRIDANLSRSFDRETIIINFNNNPVYKSLQPPKKAITTSEWRVAIEEVKYARVIERIEELKRSGLWSRKQIEPFRDPPRYKTHWDYLLEEMVWMRTDFREERKQKIKTAYVLALAVQDWHMVEDKSTVCVKRGDLKQRSLSTPPSCTLRDTDPFMDIDDRILIKSEPEDYNTNGYVSQDNKWSSSTDDVMIDVESVDDDSSARIGANQENLKDNDSIKMPPPIAPHVLQSLRQKVFNLPQDTLICRLEGSDQQIYEVDSIFPDLPVYGPPVPSENDIYFDEIHCYKIMPISKCLWRKPPKEKSNKRRYENEDHQQSKRIKLENEEETNDSQYEESILFTSHISFEKQVQIRVNAPKKDQDSTAVWYPEDDELLMSLTKKYQYNWDLIADAWNSSRGLITGYERSPWECYVRWTQKDDMSQFIINHDNESSVNEGPTVETLTDNINDTVALSPYIPGSSTLLNMRQKRDSLKNVQKRDITKPRRHSSLAEAMKKAAKKRADSNQKQLQNRKNHDQPTPINHHVMTPIELSKLKSDQERQLQTALLEQRQAAVLAFQSHSRTPMIVRPPQANPGLSYLATQTRPQVGMVANNLQALALQQRAAMHRIHPQQMTMQQAAHAQFYNQQLRARLLQGAHAPIQNTQLVQQQLVQQHAVQRQQAQIPQQPAQQAQANVGGISQSQQSTSQP